jgi:hypothetical protein
MLVAVFASIVAIEGYKVVRPKGSAMPDFVQRSGMTYAPPRRPARTPDKQAGKASEAETKAAPSTTSARIFISYRRDIDAAQAGRICDLLRGDHAFDIFMDVDAIRIGQNFITVINEEIAKCDVLLVVIGRDWLESFLS